MTYTFREVTCALIELAITTPAMKVVRKQRKKLIEIKWKRGGRFATGQEVFDHLKFLYETIYKQCIAWEYLQYTVKDKTVEFFI